MPINFGSIKVSDFEKHVKEVIDKVSNLSDEEKEQLISLWKQNNEKHNENEWQTHTNSVGKRVLSAYPSDEVNIHFPDTINGELYEISGITFRRSHIESINISNGVTLIGRLAFAHCDKLKSVTFADGFSGTIMGSAFMDCSSLEEFAFPPNTKVIEPIVHRCQSLITVYIPQSVIKIAAYALSENENLQKIYFDGTKSEWKALEKGYRWSYGLGDYTIYCLDGKIPVRKETPKITKTNQLNESQNDENLIHGQENEEYIYCNVAIENMTRKFSYITDDENITVGDMVIVPFGSNNFETIATVHSIQRCTAKNAPYPPSKTKRVLRKYTQE